MVLVEGAQVGIEVGEVLPSRRQQHLLDVGQRAAGPKQELEGIVQASRVRLLGLEERAKLANALAPYW